MKEKAVAVFDVGKTNKKILLFDFDLNLISESEERFREILDDDGFVCDDIEKIEKWIETSIHDLVNSDKYDIAGVNFATYGATLAYLDKDGKRVTPIYNYLKPLQDKIPEKIYRRFGGQDEFCRRTASPALGMLNSGMQALWLKNEKPELFAKVRHILHFPQYLSYRLTGKIYSEHTSIGCHTALWDFDNMKYHDWVKEEGLSLPDPADVSTMNEVDIDGKKIKVGIGIHDSSASLAPYFGSTGSFLLVSTGTWCINMNPFNADKLTVEQLDRDCLCYMSIAKQPVKSSRLFLGHLHEVACKNLTDHFKVNDDHYKSVRLDNKILESCRNKFGSNRFFFDSVPYSRELKKNCDYYVFKTFSEAYHQLMIELSELTSEAIDLVLPENNGIENIFITGGFSKNPLFLRLVSDVYSHKKVYTSEIPNSTALGAALVILEKLRPSGKPILNLGLTSC